MLKAIRGLSLQCLLLCSTFAVATPAFVEALEKVPFISTTPSSNPEEWLLAHIDVETTGLVARYHEIVDIGIIMTDLKGKELDRIFLRIMPDHPERTQPGAVAVNGFSVERWQSQGSISSATAVNKLFDFHRRSAREKHVILVGYNAWFDITFLDEMFRRQGKSWRELYYYFVLDLPSMAWSLGLQDLNGRDISNILGITPETTDPLEHTGMTGAEFNARVYRAMLQPQKK